MPKGEKARDIASREGVECDDCIWEALMYVGGWEHFPNSNTRVPASKKQRFIEALYAQQHQD